MRSRRYWKEFHSLFSAFDAVLTWSSWLITASFSALTIQHRTQGLLALREELTEEIERIQSAGTCWSIIENIHEDKKEIIPPTFMYLVEHIQISLPE
jgi:hypothetical protein